MRIGWHVVPLGQALVTPWSLDPHGVGGGGATPTVHAELSQVPSALQTKPEPVVGGGQGCVLPVATDVPSRAVQFAWVVVGNATAAKAVNTNSVANVREVMVNPRALRLTPITYHGRSTVSTTRRSRHVLAQLRLNSNDELVALACHGQQRVVPPTELHCTNKKTAGHTGVRINP
jgi:hypothetical protein